jgi:Tfp pilus assembly major pilin PilA
MRGKSTQRGLTLLGFIMVLMVVGIFAFVGLKLFPVYSEYYSVVSDMKGIQSEPGVANMSPEIVKDKLFRRFYISYVTSVKNEHVKVTRQNGYNLNVKYEVRKPLVYNLDFVAKFDKTVDLTRQGGDD